MKSHGIEYQTRWALVRGPKALPVLFASRRDALDNCDTDEYVVKVDVWPNSERHMTEKARKVTAVSR